VVPALFLAKLDEVIVPFIETVILWITPSKLTLALDHFHLHSVLLRLTLSYRQRDVSARYSSCLSVLCGHVRTAMIIDSLQIFTRQPFPSSCRVCNPFR